MSDNYRWILLVACEPLKHSVILISATQRTLNYFAQIYRAQYGAAMLVYLQGTPTWRPENSVNIWILLWLSRSLSELIKRTFK